jgi:predicted nucleotidyltransferase
VNKYYEKALVSTENSLTRRPAPGILPLDFAHERIFTPVQLFGIEGVFLKTLTFCPKRRSIKYSVSTETNILIQRAAAELKTAGAREIYVFGSAAKGTGDAASDLDLAVSGLPPSVFYRMGARVSDLIGRSVDLIDLDRSTPFTRYLRTENELVRVG